MKKRFSTRSYLINIVIVAIILGGLYYRFFFIPGLRFSDIAVENLKGNPIAMDIYEGKPTIVNFWSSWCGGCIKELPNFEEVKQQLGDKVHFVMVSDESMKKIERFTNSKPYSFDFVRSKKKFSYYGIRVRPCTYLYDAKGQLVSKHVGELDTKDLREIVDQVLQ